MYYVACITILFIFLLFHFGKISAHEMRKQVFKPTRFNEPFTIGQVIRNSEINDLNCRYGREFPFLQTSNHELHPLCLAESVLVLTDHEYCA